MQCFRWQTCFPGCCWSKDKQKQIIIPNKYHKMFIEKWYPILYQIQDNTVFAEYIVDCRKDYSWLIH